MNGVETLTFGELLRKYRKQNHYTQEQLAELVDLTPGFLGQIERGECYPSIDNLTKIIQTLNIDANSLFYPPRKHESDRELLYNQVRIKLSQLNRVNLECILYLAKRLEETQRDEEPETEESSH